MNPGAGQATPSVGGVGSADSESLPANFPPEFPLPDGIRVASVGQTGSSDGAYGTFFVELHSDMSKEEILEFFRRELPLRIGWNETGSEEHAGVTSVSFEPEDQPTDRMPSGMRIGVAEADGDDHRVVNLQIYQYPLR